MLFVSSSDDERKTVSESLTSVGTGTELRARTPCLSRVHGTWRLRGDPILDIREGVGCLLTLERPGGLHTERSVSGDFLQIVKCLKTLVHQNYEFLAVLGPRNLHI